MTRECLAAIPDTSISGRRVARELTTLIELRGKPRIIVSDNGTELTSNAILAWQQEHAIEWHYIAPEAACAMNFSTRACFWTSIRLAKSSLPGSPTTTRRGKGRINSRGSNRRWMKV
jgi:hypothetical protein